MPLRPSPVDLRRAVLGHLMRGGGPASIDDVVAAVRPELGAWNANGWMPESTDARRIG